MRAIFCLLTFFIAPRFHSSYCYPDWYPRPTEAGRPPWPKSSAPWVITRGRQRGEDCNSAAQIARGAAVAPAAKAI